MENWSFFSSFFFYVNFNSRKFHPRRKVIFPTYFLLHIGSNLNATKDFPSWKVRSAKREISHRCSEVIRRSFLLRSSFSAVGSHPRWEEVDLIPGDKFSSRSAGNALPDFDSVQCSSSTFDRNDHPSNFSNQTQNKINLYIPPKKKEKIELRKINISPNEREHLLTPL